MLTSDSSTTVSWRRPHLLTIEPGLLRAGDNELLVQSTYRGGVHFFGDVELMPLASAAAAQRRHYFGSATLPWVGAPVVTISVYSRVRRESRR